MGINGSFEPAPRLFQGRDRLEKAGPLSCCDQIASGAHFQERGSLQTVRDERHGELTMQAVVPRLSDTPGTIRSAGPALGADTESVLTQLLGRSAADVAALRDKGVIGREGVA